MMSTLRSGRRISWPVYQALTRWFSFPLSVLGNKTQARATIRNVWFVALRVIIRCNPSGALQSARGTAILGASDLRVPSKVKAEADAVEIDRARPAGITLSQETKVLQIAS